MNKLKCEEAAYRPEALEICLRAVAETKRWANRLAAGEVTPKVVAERLRAEGSFGSPLDGEHCPLAQSLNRHLATFEKPVTVAVNEIGAVVGVLFQSEDDDDECPLMVGVPLPKVLGKFYQAFDKGSFKFLREDKG